SHLTESVMITHVQLPSHLEICVGNPRVKFEPGLDLPKRIRLAHPFRQFCQETTVSTSVQGADVDEWIGADQVQAYQTIEIELQNEILIVAGPLKFALRQSEFENWIDQFTPMEFMRCVIGVIAVLVQTGPLKDAVDNDSLLFTADRLMQIFELAEP